MESHIVAALTPELLAAACRPWRIQADQLRLIRDYENFVYEAVVGSAGTDPLAPARGQQDGRAVLRITHASHRRRGDLEAELEFVESLADAGLPTCRPLLSQTGERVVRISEEFLVCCFPYARGRKMTWRDPAVWNTRSFRSWGRVLAQFHRHAEGYEPKLSTRRQRWDEDDVTCVRYLPPEDDDISERLVAAISDLRQRATGHGQFGLIHSDLHQGNFFALPDDGSLAVFDFDDAIHHWFSYDLATVLYHLPEGEGSAPPRPDRSAVIQEILAGYAQARPLPEDLNGDLRRFLLLRDLQMYQNMHKKTLPADRLPWWFQAKARTAMRIRAGELACELPR